MLCFNLKIAAIFRAYRDHRDESVRSQRSQSVCTPQQRPPNRDIGALRVLQRRASSVISSATELISRRGILSRRNYSSVDQFTQNESDQNFRRFRIENGKTLEEKDEVFGSPNQILILENPEHQTRWYFKYFLGKLHQNYAGIDSDKNPYFLSIVLNDTGTNCMPLYRTILFRKQGTEKIALPLNITQKFSVKQILNHFPCIDTNKIPREIFSSEIQKDLLLLEEQEGSVNFKFGIVYMKCGQTNDDEMLSNENGSKNFDEFLNVLGEKICLKNFKHYRGGLDIKGDMTGKYSIYTIYEGHEIMFHVSTLLPFSHDNRQQVERKRHIGNDIVNIVFIDHDGRFANGRGDNNKDLEGCTDNCDYNFIPNCIRSQFTHIFAVVSKHNEMYKLSVYSDINVPQFGPTLPSPPIFDNPNAFREFLLVKLINGEKATFQTTTFSKKRERTLELLIKDLYEEYCHDTKMTMLNRRAFSEVLYDIPGKILKEDTRQIEFIQIGQALKLEAIIRGDAPTSRQQTSTRNGSIFKRPPWEPKCFYKSFIYGNILVGDSFEQNNLIVTTENAGTFLIKEDQSIIQIFDNTIHIRQLTVVEEHGIILIRGGTTTQKDTHRIHVFRLNEIKNFENRIRTKYDVKEMRLEKTKGLHLYTTSKGWDGHMRMAVAIGKRLLIYQWKHSAAWTSFCPESDHDTVDGFFFLRELTLHDCPTLLTILEGPSNGVKICVGFKYHFEIVSEMSEHSTKLYEIENGKKESHLQTALDLCDGIETELLLCFDHTCHFQKLSDDTKPNYDFDFHWNTIPNSIVCAFPYVIAFTKDSMEIRLLVNGNLVQTITMIDLQLITSKRDIYFIAKIPEFDKQLKNDIIEQQEINNVNNINNDDCKINLNNNLTTTNNTISNHKNILKRELSGNSCQHQLKQNHKTLQIYRIPLINLIGSHHHQIHNPHSNHKKQ